MSHMGATFMETISSSRFVRLSDLRQEKLSPRKSKTKISDYSKNYTGHTDYISYLILIYLYISNYKISEKRVDYISFGGAHRRADTIIGSIISAF